MYYVYTRYIYIYIYIYVVYTRYIKLCMIVEFELDTPCIVSVISYATSMHTQMVMNVSTRYKTIISDTEPERHLLAGVGRPGRTPRRPPLRRAKAMTSLGPVRRARTFSLRSSTESTPNQILISWKPSFAAKYGFDAEMWRRTAK